MKTNEFKTIILSLFFSLIISCKKSYDCISIPEIVTSISSSHPCLPNGTIKVISPIESHLMYKIDNQNFQADLVFKNISAGKHTLTIKNKDGCEKSKDVTIDTILIGDNFNELKGILVANCSSCHSGPNPQAGIDFTRNCDIFNHGDRIKDRAIDAIPTPMPPLGLMTKEERNILLKWINNGHNFEN